MSGGRAAALVVALAAVLIGSSAAHAGESPTPTRTSTATPTPSVTPKATNSAPVREPDADARPYPGDPERESALVASEDARLSEARTVASLSRWTDKPLTTPYRLATEGSYTLVLTARRSAYTLTDLLVLAPQTFVRQADGAYLLSEHIVVQSGATLRLAAPDRLVVRLASDNRGFVSIVGYGGRLETAGTAAHPVVVTSWDRQRNAPDGTTTDGRAYLRAIGGQVALQHTVFSNLGFWSGRTGGLSLTGTDRPTPGALDALGKQMTVRDEKARAAARDATPEAELPDSTNGVTLDKVLPTGKLPLPTVDIADPTYSYVSVQMSHVRSTGAAFGLFVAGANGVDIRDSEFERSLLDGIVFHRYVTNAVIERTKTHDNNGDGVVISRATTGTIVSELESRDNAANGVTLSGLPLADGPSATGTPVGDYGNNTLSNGTITDNGRYGVEVVGGHHISVSANHVAGNDMGIVVRDGATDVTVVGNSVDSNTRQGISVRDGVTGAKVTGNITTGGETALYVRDSVARVERNTLTGASLHSVSLVGVVDGTIVDLNTVSGRGPSAIDTVRAADFSMRGMDNDTSGWVDTTPWLVTLKRLLQPLTLLWTALGLIVVVTAVRGVRDRRQNRTRAYADREPLHRPSDVVYAAPPVAARAADTP